MSLETTTLLHLIGETPMLVKMQEAQVSFMEFCRSFFHGLLQRSAEFMEPSWNALRSFQYAEGKKAMRIPLDETVRDYEGLTALNFGLMARFMDSSQKAANEYCRKLWDGATDAFIRTISGEGGESIEEFWKNQAAIMDSLANVYPGAIKKVKEHYGFHFDNGGYVKVAETERFLIYQVLPTNGVEINRRGKPILIIPPVVLGHNVVAFLVNEGISYVHQFANRGIPTYARILKNIATTPAVQLMTGEDDVLDTRKICERLMANHGKPVTLNGICQGGFMAAAGVMTRKYHGVVDKLITCVSPMAGVRGGNLIEYMEHLGERFVDLNHSIKFLSNGNPVIDGDILGWVYKLRSIERDGPVVSFLNDATLLGKFADPAKIPLKPAAINHWMLYDRIDLPPEIVRLSFLTYTNDVENDGTLPAKLFGERLNFKSINELGVKWLICIAEKDDLVPAEVSLAPLDYVEAEVSVFQGGHINILTSPGFKPVQPSYRNPVDFHLDLDHAEITEPDYGLPDIHPAATQMVA